MAVLTDIHFNILLRKNLILSWCSLPLSEMSIIIEKFVTTEILNEICDKNIKPEIAAHRLHRHVLQSNDDNFYTSIMNFSKDKSTSLLNLLNTLWIDVSEDESSSSNFPLTSEQFDLLLKKDILMPLFKSIEKVEAVVNLFQEFTPVATNIALFTAEALHKQLLLSNNKQFYDKLCKLVSMEFDKYQNCFDLMSDNHLYHVEDEEELQIPLNTNRFQSNFQGDIDLTAQLCEMRSAVGCVTQVITDEIDELKQLMVNKMNGNETNMKQLVKNLQDELNDSTREQLSQVKEEMIEETEALKKQIDLLQMRLNLMETANERKSRPEQISSVETEELSIKKTIIEQSSPPSMGIFRLKPSLEMKTLQENYKFAGSGLSPLLPDEWGFYSSVNWLTIGGKYDWRDRWTKIIQKKRSFLYLPPLLLPIELGGWCLQFFLRWNNNGLMLCGHIVDNLPNFPEQLKIHFQMQLLINKEETFMIDEIFPLATSIENVWNICPNVDKDWAIPVICIQVKP